jgi:peptide/nickel transport system substrate-binding protein
MEEEMRRLSLIAASLALLLALGATQSMAQTYQEAPMLSAMVAAGELPPVAQRLPKEPYVGIDQVPVSDLQGGKLEIGRYGGIIKGDTPHNQWRIEAIGKKGIRFNPQDAYPHFFKSFSVSPDGKVYTFTLREGLKWSDGMPHTTDDVRFWYEDVLLNSDLTPSVRVDFMSGSRGDSEVLELNIVDESTFQFIYDETPWDLLSYFSHVDWDPVAYSRSFFSRYHPDYTAMAEIDTAAVEHGFEKGEWAKLFRHLSGWPKLPTTLPTISPFLLKDDNAQQMVWERNPYYWKVDAANNQLPYLDGWVWVKTADTEVVRQFDALPIPRP